MKKFAICFGEPLNGWRSPRERLCTMSGAEANREFHHKNSVSLLSNCYIRDFAEKALKFSK